MPVTRLDARLRLLAAAVLFSTGGAAIKAASLTSWQVSSFRSGIAALAVWLLVPAARRRWSLPVLAVAAIYAATMVLFVIANKRTTSANAIFLQSTAPLWVLLAGPALLGERTTRRDLIFMGVVALGMTFFFVGEDAPQATAPDPSGGNVIAALSGVAWAGTVLGLRWLGRGGGSASAQVSTADLASGDAASGDAATGHGDEALTTVVAGNVLACLVGLPFALPVSGAGTADWLVVLYLGVVQIGLAYLALSTAMPHVPALEASTLLLVEPALNPVWAYLAHGERPGPLAWIGGALIVLAAVAKTWWDTQRPASPATVPSSRAALD